MYALRRGICAVILLTLCMNFMPRVIFAAEIPPAEVITEPTLPVTEAPKGWGLYFGQLHSHSNISDGYGTVEEAFAHAAAVPNLDFLAVTDHSESISGAAEGSLTEDMTARSTDWAAGKAAAAGATNRDFVGIYGFEMSWPQDKQIGHINTFNTPGFVSWQQPAFSQPVAGLEQYAAALGTVPGAVSQFNHPGREFGDFLGFSRYSEAVDEVVQLLEVGTGQNPYKYYTQALDYGWHVAPTCNQNNHSGSWGSADSSRTVVAATTLTEAGIYEALRSRRVYATQDSDLRIFFSQMGSRLARRGVGSVLHLSVSVGDATDAAIGTVEVIVNGGVSAAAQTLSGNSGEITFSLPANYDYYYLRVTQPDGDTAVTAPVWLEGEADVGIRAFGSDTALPVQGRPINLSLTLGNGGVEELQIEKIDFSIDGEIFHTTGDIAILPAGAEKTYTFSHTFYQLGITKITASVTATLGGEARLYEKTLTISFRRDDMIKDILVDGCHNNAGLDRLTNLSILAAENRLGVSVADGDITPEHLAKAGILLVNAPAAEFSEAFVQTAAEFVRYGGTLILCGRSAALDGTISSAGQLNRILQEAGSTLSFRKDGAVDDVHNSGSPDQLYPVRINTTASWCAHVSEDQVYRHFSGCTIDPGSGAWLVKGHDTTQSTLGGNAPVLMAWEALPGGGRIFAAGSLWLLEEELAEPKNIWDTPYANRTILEAILGVAPPEISLMEIGAVRRGSQGKLCRIRGYVTAGTSRPGNRFPDTIYLQDDTGGIAVTPFVQEGIPVGTAMEIIGYLETAGKNKQFHTISYEILEVSDYRYQGLTGQYREILDNSRHGGELVQVEGIVERIELTEEGTLSQIILRDESRNYAAILVEDYIFSGATGKNELAREIQTGEQVRALGLLHKHSDGTAVVRVRNCDEVVVIDPWPYDPDRVYKVRDRSNPHTGDSIGVWLPLMLLSAALLPKKKRTQ